MNRKLIRLTESDIHNIIKETVSKVLTTLNEGFKSNELRQWFSQHGGVKRLYTGEEGEEGEHLVDKRVSQPGLGNVMDKDILYMREFDNENDAYSEKYRLTQSDKYTRQRSDWDMKAFFLIYKANDGKCILVGLDRGNPDNPNYGFTWGGELDKKTAKRRMDNGWNFKTRSNHFYDMPKEVYYHQGAMNDFGLWNSDNYKGKLEDNKRKKERMTPEEWEQYVKDQLEHNQNYLKNRYGKSFRRPK